MDIDMSALRLLEREREIPLDLLIPTIEIGRASCRERVLFEV